jgi:hypothetical protein
MVRLLLGSAYIELPFKEGVDSRIQAEECPIRLIRPTSPIEIKTSRAIEEILNFGAAQLERLCCRSAK